MQNLELRLIDFGFKMQTENKNFLGNKIILL